MNTVLTIVFLLLPAYPSFIDIWLKDAPADPVIMETPVSTSQYMSDAELKKQVELLKKISDPVTRSRIVVDIGNSCNKNVFTVLDEWLPNEKDPAVRADIISVLAHLPIRAKRPTDLPAIEINWESAHADEYEKSSRSSYLPEKMAAEKFLNRNKANVLTPPAVENVITKEQTSFFQMRNDPSAEQQNQLLKVIDSSTHPLVRIEAIRSIASNEKLLLKALPQLEKIITKPYIRPDSRFDHDAVRAAAFMALVEHKNEPKVAALLKKTERQLNKTLKSGKNPLLHEYFRQIQSYRNGKKEIVPAPLPAKGKGSTFSFKDKPKIQQ